MKTDRRIIILAALALLFSALACGGEGLFEMASIQSDAAYWTCITATPVPTREIIVGTATPLTPPDPLQTPELIRRYTTPVPTETPQYQVEQFYFNQLVHVSGIGIMLKNLVKTPSDTEGMAQYTWTFEITNRSGQAMFIPLDVLTGLRQVVLSDGEVVTGRWLPDNSFTNKDGNVFADGEKREISTTIEAPDGEVNELLVAGLWKSGIEGGVPLYFLNADYPFYCAYGSARWNGDAPPPPPTPNVISLLTVSGSAGTGVCGPPATGTFMRGWGCSQFDTGIAGRGCTGAAPWFHNGWDIANSVGTDVVSPVDGEVISTEWNVYGLGNEIKIASGNEVHSLGHLDSYVVGVGPVTAGQHVGEMGSTGRSTGSHVHWTIRRNGIDIDPATWTGCTATGS